MSNSRLDKLLEMLEKQPDDPFLLYAVGFEYEAIGEDSPAIDYYSLSLEKHPDYLPVYYQWALLSDRLGDTEKSISLLKEGITLAQTQKDRKTENELRQALEEMDE